MRARIRALHDSIRTEQAYVDWIKRYIVFSGRRHPRDLSAAHVERFLSHLAVDRNVAASTQNQAKSAVLFLYKEVLQVELTWLQNVTQARVPRRLPLVLTRSEVERILAHLRTETLRLIGGLLYGSGLRLLEALRLRVKDVDVARGELIVREGKGFKDRVTMIPQSLCLPLQTHLAKVRALHQADLAAGLGNVHLPFALHRKYPHAGREWGWQYVFPAAIRSTDPRTGAKRRHHVHEQAFQRAFKQALRDAALVKPRDAAQPAAFVRDASAGKRLRHPHAPGVARSQQRADDDDLHPRAESRPARRAQSAGSDRHHRVGATVTGARAARRVQKNARPYRPHRSASTSSRFASAISPARVTGCIAGSGCRGASDAMIPPSFISAFAASRPACRFS